MKAPPSRWAVVVYALLTFFGSALSTAFLALDVGGHAVAGLFLTGCWWVGFGRTTPVPRLLRWPARAIVLGYHVLLLYLALTFGLMLAWSVPPWVVWTAGILGVLALLTLRNGLFHLRVPPVLPLSLWVVACLLGWQREDGTIRCQDYRRLMAQPGTSLVASSSPELEHCEGDDILRLARYPRRIWESPDRSRLVVTTQEGIGHYMPLGRKVASNFTGSICALDAVDPSHPNCLGWGKAQAIMEDAIHDTVFVAAWGQNEKTPGFWGVLYELPQHGPWRVLREQKFKGNIGEGFVDPALDTAALALDEGLEMLVVKPSTMETVKSVPYDLIPTDTHYDPRRHEGVFCSGGWPFKELVGLAIAFRGDPFRARSLGHTWTVPWSYLGMPEGCDWDADARRVYVAAANLGLLSTVDYDTGRYLSSKWVGFGARAVVLDPQRQRIYVSNFLRGDVQEIDVASGTTLRRWFAGRFVRFLFVSRDGHSLLAGSNAGVVRLALD